MANGFGTFERLLHEAIYFETFHRLSAVLVEREPLHRWVSQGYYATLVAGALSRADLSGGGFRGAVETAELIRAFLEAGFFLGDTSLEDRKAVAAQAIPDAAYKPQYDLDDVKTVLDRAVLIFERTPPAQQLDAIRESIFESGDAGIGRVGRSIVALWYTSSILDLGEGLGFITKTAPIQTYGEGLVWQAIGSAPPGLPGPYYGDWAYPSPQPILPPEYILRGRQA